MRPNVLTFIIAIAAISLLAFSAQTAQAQQVNQPPRYYVFNLGDPGAGSVAAAASINNLSWIAGDSWESGNTNEHAFLWLGVPVDLGTLGGPNSAVAWPNKNNLGQLAGIAETANMNPYNEAWSCALANFPTITNHICLGFTWEDGVMTALPALPGGIDSYAAGINNKGQIAGWAENGVHDSTCTNAPPFNQVLQFEAVVWGPGLGEITQLSPLASDPDSAATAINDKGQIVGISGLCGIAAGSTSAEHAVLWENKYATPTDLGNFDGGMAWNTPTAINRPGRVVGFGNQQGSLASAFNPIGFYWTKEHGIRPVAPLGTDNNSWVWGINRDGVAVGQSFASPASLPAGEAFVYKNGVATDLNKLIQRDSSLQLWLANDINDAGEIVGFALDTTTGAVVAFLAVPVEDGNQFRTSRSGNLRSKGVPESARRSFVGNFSRLGSGSIGPR